jgi:hypothetical protein
MFFSLSLLFLTVPITGERTIVPGQVCAEIVAFSGESGGGSGGGSGSGGNPDRIREPRISGGKVDRVKEPHTSGNGSGGGGREVRTSDGGSSGSGGRSGSGSERMGGSGGSGSSGSGSGSGSSSGTGSGSSGSSGSGSGSSGSGSGSSGSGSGSNSGSGSSNSGSGSSGSSGLDVEHSAESVESVGEMRKLAAREAPDFDSQGFPVRRGEVIGLDLSRDEVARAQRLGFSVGSERKLASLDMRVTRLRAPADMQIGDAVRLLRDDNANKGAVYDFDHFYGVNGYEDAGTHSKATPPPRGNLWIGMIDTGVTRHLALKGVRVDTRDFSLTTKGQVLPSKHGTAVASILARYGAGRITSANIFTADGKPYAAADTIAAALDWLVQQQAPVINISLAGPRNALLDAVVARAIAKGHVIVAAAGNGGPAAAPAYPGAIAGVVAATAVDGANHIYRYANQGDYVFVAAPGVGVPAAAADGAIAAYSGTSFASPIVAASMARCKRSAGTSACIDHMRATAIDLGAPGKDPVYGWGLIRN